MARRARDEWRGECFLGDEGVQALLDELLLRFAVGGAVVSSFAVLGDIFKPKTFSGLFGAAPSVALVTLAFAFGQEGQGFVAELGRSMVIGAVALLAYGAVCAAAMRRYAWPVWLVAGVAWVVWLAIAFTIWGAGQATGALR